jgi:hypothetical protein
VRLAQWPVARPAGWVERVNAMVAKEEFERPGSCIRRSRPFGDDAWVRRTARRLGLESTLRDPWGPKKPSPAQRRRIRGGKEECPLQSQECPPFAGLSGTMTVTAIVLRDERPALWDCNQPIRCTPQSHGAKGAAVLQDRFSLFSQQGEIGRRTPAKQRQW